MISLSVSLSLSISLSLRRQALVDAVTPFYRDCLTVNASCNPAEVMERLLADDFLSIGVPNKSKQALMGQVQFFWKLIPDLKWEIQELFVDGNKVVVRSLASGSPRGDFMGLTGLDGSKSFHVTTIDIHTVENGRLKVVNHLEDWSIAKAQLAPVS
jgi:predicted ester cyclase